MLEIGRQHRPDLYALEPRRTPPLVPADLRFEVAERVDYQGVVLTPLDSSGLPEIIAALRREGWSRWLCAYCSPFSTRSTSRRSWRRYTPQASRCRPHTSSSRSSGNTSAPAHHGERLCLAGDGALPLQLAAPTPRGTRPATGHAVQRRHHYRRGRQGRGGAHGAVRPGRRRGGRSVYGGAFWLHRHHLFRHGRHLHRCGTGTKPVAGNHRGDHWRPARLSPHAGHPHRGRRRRLHRGRDAGGALRVGPESAGADPGPACYGKGSTSR